MKTFDWNPGQLSSIDAGGKCLEAVAFGPSPGQAPTIVMLHEGLGCTAMWRDFPQKIAEHDSPSISRRLKPEIFSAAVLKNVTRPPLSTVKIPTSRLSRIIFKLRSS